MSFIPSTLDYESVDTVVASAALQKMLKHIRYLVEETIVHAIFPDNLVDGEKAALAR